MEHEQHTGARCDTLSPAELPEDREHVAEDRRRRRTSRPAGRPSMTSGMTVAIAPLSASSTRRTPGSHARSSLRWAVGDNAGRRLAGALGAAGPALLRCPVDDQQHDYLVRAPGTRPGHGDWFFFEITVSLPDNAPERERIEAEMRAANADQGDADVALVTSKRFCKALGRQSAARTRRKLAHQVHRAAPRPINSTRTKINIPRAQVHGMFFVVLRNLHHRET